MSKALRLLGWLVLIALLALLPGREPSTTGRSLSARLLGPVGSLAAGWQWVRVRQAIEAGRPGLGYSRAELAFELDPSSTAAWSFLASHYAHDRASAEAEPDPELRTSWVRAALALLERGESTAAKPAELALHRGLILIHVGDMEGTIPWPGGARGAWLEAGLAFERAIELDPGDSQGWIQLGRLRALRLGSPELQPSQAERLAALEATLELLERGTAEVRRPGMLFFERGLLLGITADGGDGAAWPGGRRALYQAALRAFEQAEAEDPHLARRAGESARAALSALEQQL